jgi:hypothetical protein
MFSDVFVTHIGNLNIVAVSAWLPWVVMALHRGLTRRSLNWCVLAGLMLGVAALAGHAQMTLGLALALGVYALGRILARLDTPFGGLGRMAVVFLIAVGLAAISLLPAVELTAHTARARLDYSAASEYSLPWAGLAGWISPLIFGRGVDGFWAPWPRVELGYVGVVTLWLAGLAPWRGDAGRVPRALAAVGAIGLLLALGENTIVHRLFYTLVPGFSNLRVPARFILLSGFAVAALAGFGLARLPSLPARQVLRWSGIFLGVMLLLTLMAWLSVPGHEQHASEMFVGLGIGVLLLAAGTGLSLAPQRSWMPAALAAVVAVDLIGHGAWVEVELDDPTRGYQHPAVVEYLLSQPGPLRIDSAAAAWAPDAAARFGLEDIGGISNPLALAAYDTYRGAVGSRGTPLYNFLNAQFVLSDKGVPPGDSRLVPVFNEDPEIDVYLNTGAQPRIRLVHRAEVVTSGETAFGAIHAPGFDPEQVVVLDATSAQVPPQMLLGDLPQGTSNLFYSAYTPEAQTVVVQSSGPAYLVLSEVWYPGWRAWVDGVETPIYRANFAFRAVFVPEGGEHTITVRFDPLSWKVGSGVTGATLVLLILLALQWFRNTRKAQPV